VPTGLQDVFVYLEPTEQWRCCMQNVTRAVAEEATRALEANGRRVRRFTATAIGRIVYETPTREES
jgi:hypothetical protein